MNHSGLKRKLIYLLVPAILGATNIYAQRGAIEIAMGGGVSINSNPGKNMMYKGNKMTLNYSSGMSLAYNIHRSMAVGAEVRILELSRISDAVYPTYLKTTIGGDGKRFVYSKSMISACATFNGKFTIPRGYFYGGAAAGYGLSYHDSKTLGTRESYRAPNGGQGVVLGLQAGYTHGISSAFGIYAEAALRNYHLSYDALAPEVRPYMLLNYNITAYTLTAGIKLRIMPKYRPQNDIPPLRGRGRSHK